MNARKMSNAFTEVLINRLDQSTTGRSERKTMSDVRKHNRDSEPTDHHDVAFFQFLRR